MLALVFLFVFIISLLVLLVFLIQNYFILYENLNLEINQTNEQAIKNMESEKKSGKLNELTHVFDEVFERRITNLNHKFSMEENENNDSPQDDFTQSVIDAIRSSLKLLKIKL